jgi:hypothetical protein
MLGAEEENWRDREESLEFAVLVIVAVERGSKFNLCMKRRKKDQQRRWKLFIGLG